MDGAGELDSCSGQRTPGRPPRAGSHRRPRLFPDQLVTLHVARLGNEDHRHAGGLHRLYERPDPERAVAVGNVPYLTGITELVVGELHLQR